MKSKVILDDIYENDEAFLKALKESRGKTLRFEPTDGTFSYRCVGCFHVNPEDSFFIVTNKEIHESTYVGDKFEEYKKERDDFQKNFANASVKKVLMKTYMWFSEDDPRNKDIQKYNRRGYTAVLEYSRLDHFALCEVIDDDEEKLEKED